MLVAQHLEVIALRGFKYVFLPVILLAALSVPGAAFADPIVTATPVGLQNPSFEQGFDYWTATFADGGNEGYTCATDPDDWEYYPGCVDVPAVPATTGPATCDAQQLAGLVGHQDGACIVGTDSFTAFNDFYAGWTCPDIGDPDYDPDCEDVPDSGTPIAMTVSPLDGSKMLRLGGPFASASENQALTRLRVDQTFIVDPAQPVLPLNYNVMTFDYQGFDELRVRVRITDENGDVIAEEVQGAFGPGGDTSFKSTGWQKANVDLTGYEGETVHLRIDAGGTWDNLFGFWVYIDAGDAPESPVGSVTATAPALPGGGTAAVHVLDDESTGQSWVVFAQSDANKFPSACMPVPLAFNLNAAGGTIGNAELIVHASNGGGTEHIPLTGPPGGGSYTGTVPCVAGATLMLSYELTDDSQTQGFLIPVGGLALIDPQGIVFNQAKFDSLVAGGASVTNARKQAAIEGATVRLQRLENGTWHNVLAGDPGISPNVNPQKTDASGKYQWDVSPGTYRVKVLKLGFVSSTSIAVAIPPPVLDLHIGMTPDGGGTTTSATTESTETKSIVEIVKSGGSGNDSLRGNDLNDRLFGRGGADLMFGWGGADFLDGGPGRDKIFGGDGDDMLRGGAGNDKIDGGKGKDAIIGGTGRDTVAGGPGADVIDVHDGSGGDRVKCGSGADTVSYDRGDRLSGCELKLRAT